MNLEQRTEKLDRRREKETERILQELNTMTHTEREIYLQAYADALEYVSDMQHEQKVRNGYKIEEYLP